VAEVQDLKVQLELRAQDIKTLNGQIDGLKGVNEELKVDIRWVMHCYSGD
jgi:kinesin family protein 5